MKQIEVTDEMYDFLIELSKEINTQDNRATAMPYFFQIQTNEEVAVPEGCGEKAWYNDGSKIQTQDEIDQVLFDYYDPRYTMEEIKVMDEWDKFDMLRDQDWREIYFDFKHEYQGSFLTAKACQEHIRLNHYHYREPETYLQHAWRNPEMEMLFKFLCELTKGKLHI
jgi:hypothetical protein